MNFNQQLIIAIVDKLIIGSFILIAGFFFNRALERFKDQLSHSLKEHEIRLSKLHEKRSQAILDLYAALFDFRLTVEQFLFRASLPDDVKKVHQKVKIDFYNVNKIAQTNRPLFSESVCKQIDDIIELLKARADLFAIAYGQGQADNTPSYKEWGELRDKLLPLQQSLENDFRLLLGSQ